MTSLSVHLLVDPRGWPTTLDPEVVSAILQSRLPRSVDLRAEELRPRWVEFLPGFSERLSSREEVVVFLFLTFPLAPGWQDSLQRWLSPKHTLYAVYTDSAQLSDHREIAAMTVSQPIARAPYRIVLQTSTGLERAADWMVSIVKKMMGDSRSGDSRPAKSHAHHAASPPVSHLHAATSMPLEPAPPIRVQGTRWRNMPSNRQDIHAYPDQLTFSNEGIGGYRMVAASNRGKTHAHHGTFREDAVAITATRHWNIMAVADGAGTARLARVGSNLAVTHAVEAMSSAMPAKPETEDLGRAIWAGLKAAHSALKNFSAEHNVALSDLYTTLQLLIHWPQTVGCLLGVVHVGDGIVTAETIDGQYYLLTDPDVDPDDNGRTLFLTSGPLRQWMERTKVYQFDEPLDIVALMTDGLSGDLEPHGELLHTHLFEALRNRVLCYPLKQREQALLAFISYDRRGSFDDRTIAVLSRE